MIDLLNHKMRLHLLIPCLFMAVQANQVIAEDKLSESYQYEQAKILRWLEIEKTLTDEKKDFVASARNLERLLDVYKTELTLLEEEIAASEQQLGLEKSELDRIKLSTNKLKASRKSQGILVEIQAKRLLKILKRLPYPLVQQVMEDQKILMTTSSSMRNKALAMLSIVKATHKFNQVVTYSEEVQMVEGVERQLRVLYLGLGRGYYLSGNTSGIAMPIAEGWAWSRKDDYFDAISKAMDVHLKVARPELIKLPLSIKE